LIFAGLANAVIPGIRSGPQAVAPRATFGGKLLNAQAVVKSLSIGHGMHLNHKIVRAILD